VGDEVTSRLELTGKLSAIYYPAESVLDLTSYCMAVFSRAFYADRLKKLWFIQMLNVFNV